MSQGKEERDRGAVYSKDGLEIGVKKKKVGAKGSDAWNSDTVYCRKKDVKGRRRTLKRTS